MTEQQIKEIYKLADVLETITNNDADLFETALTLDNTIFQVELEPLEYARVVAKAVSNKLFEIVNMEEKMI